jgi:putative FmdB family regulatory protein
MASYDYKCTKCTEITLVSHPINDSPEILCPKCQEKMEKVYSSPALSFKGGGWAHKEN